MSLSPRVATLLELAVMAVVHGQPGICGTDVQRKIEELGMEASYRGVNEILVRRMEQGHINAEPIPGSAGWAQKLQYTLTNPGRKQLQSLLCFTSRLSTEADMDTAETST